MEIKIKYHSERLERLTSISVGNWIDLRSAEEVILHEGQDRLISLGVSMKLPDGYEAHIVPRSSTFKHFGITQVNSIGIVDSAYSGNEDVWKFWALAVRKSVIHLNDRICQFRIMQVQPEILFTEVDTLENPSRGGFGSTGINMFINPTIK